MELDGDSIRHVFSDEVEQAYSYLDRLALQFCLNLIRPLGPLRPGTMIGTERHRVAHEGEYLLRTAFNILAGQGYVFSQDNGWTVCRPWPEDGIADLQREAREQCPGAVPIFELFERCHAHAAAFLAGRQSGLNVVFPRGDLSLWERVHCEDLVMSLYADLVPPALAGILAGRETRVLEVGAGMGAVLRRCHSLLHDRGVKEYWFTDLGRTFVRRMEQAHPESSILHFAVLDLDLPFAGQGILPDGFDAIVAVNVLHSVKNVEFTLCELRAALREGGALILAEGSPPRPGKRWPLDLVFAFLRGWWDVALDPQRRPRPGFLFPSEWLEWLRYCEFADVTALPGEDSFRRPCRGGLVIATKGGT